MAAPLSFPCSCRYKCGSGLGLMKENPRLQTCTFAGGDFCVSICEESFYSSSSSLQRRRRLNFMLPSLKYSEAFSMLWAMMRSGTRLITKQVGWIYFFIISSYFLKNLFHKHFFAIHNVESLLGFFYAASLQVEDLAILLCLGLCAFNAGESAKVERHGLHARTEVG